MFSNFTQSVALTGRTRGRVFYPSLLLFVLRGRMNQRVSDIALSEYQALNIECGGMLNNIVQFELWWYIFSCVKKNEKFKK